MANRYFTLMNLILVTLGVYFAVSIFYAVVTARLTGSPLEMPVGRSDIPTGPTAVSQLTDYQVIVERNLFNSGRQTLAGAPKAGDAGVDVDKLKQTELKLKLWGTTAGQVEAAPAAFIEDPKTREHKMFRTGDTVQNATVKLILREKVVLSVNGKDEVLIQEEPGVIKTVAAGAARPPGADEPPEPIVMKEEQVERVMENLGDLMSQATFRPHLEDGQPAGISITGIKPNAVFRKLRLRNGDVITGVNDQAVASVEDAVKVFGTLSTDAPIQVKIKRRGREQTLEYRME